MVVAICIFVLKCSIARHCYSKRSLKCNYLRHRKEHVDCYYDDICFPLSSHTDLFPSSPV
jgi:hypothetical protein